MALDAHLWLTLAPLVWISSLKDESWPNIETLETDSMASLPVAAHLVDERLSALENDDAESLGVEGKRIAVMVE